MAGAMVRIRSVLKDLPKAEKRISDYVLKYPEKVPFLSVNELAKATKVSIASVSRLSKRSGCANFKEFKIEIAQEISSGKHIDSIYQAITPDDSNKEIIDKVFGGNIKSLDDTLKILDKSGLIKASKVIARAERLVFFGVGSSGNIAQDAALRFAHLGIHADAYIDSYESLIQALKMKKKCVAFGISHSGRTKATVATLKLARESGAFVIGITNYPQSPLAKVSDIYFCTSFPESRVRATALSARPSQVCLIDAIYALVARQKMRTRNMEQLNLLTDKLLRLQGKR